VKLINVFDEFLYQEAMPAVIRFGEKAGIVVDSANTIKVMLPKRLQKQCVRNSENIVCAIALSNSSFQVSCLVE
jgi:hypothetical protein